MRLCIDAFSQQLQGLVQVLLGSVELHGLLLAHLSGLPQHRPPRSWFPAPPPPPHMPCTPSLSATDSLPIALSGPHSLPTPHQSPLSACFLHALCKNPFSPFRIFLWATCLLCSRILFRCLFFRRIHSLPPSGVHFLQLNLRWTSSCNKGLLLQSSSTTCLLTHGTRHEGNLEITPDNLVCLHPVLLVFFGFPAHSP